MILARLLPAIALTLLLSGCIGADFSDLDAFMADARNRPTGTIEPIPTFKPYKAFTYGAQEKRPPFDRPIKIEIVDCEGDECAKAPDETRAKEFLEGFNFESLTMVGTLQLEGTLWGLVNDGRGGVHRVQTGNHLGQDYGEITEIAQTYIRVMEITPNGVGGWLRRPRLMELRERN